MIDTVIVWCCAAAGAEAESLDEWQLDAEPMATDHGVDDDGSTSYHN